MIRFILFVQLDLITYLDDIIIFLGKKLYIDISHLRCNIWHFKMVLIYALQNHNYSSATIATAIENKIDVEKRFQYVHIIHTNIYFQYSRSSSLSFYFYPALFSPLNFFFFILLYLSNFSYSNYTYITFALQMRKLREKGWILCVHMAWSVSM